MLPDMDDKPRQAAQPSQADCLSASTASLLTCRTNSGAECIHSNKTTRPYTCTMDEGLGLGSSQGVLTCANSTTAEFCKPGNYCMQGYSYPCLAGFYCPIGTANPIACPFSILSCPDAHTAYFEEGVVFALLFVIFTTILSLYWAFGNASIRSDANRKWEKIARVVSVRQHDPVNGLVLEHDQHVVVKTTGKINEARAARERAVSSGRWKDVLLDSTAGLTPPPGQPPVSRFSTDFRGRNSSIASNLSAAAPACELNGAPLPNGDHGAGQNRLSQRLAPVQQSPGHVAILSPNTALKGPLAVEGGRKDKVARAGSKLRAATLGNLPDYEQVEVEVPLTVAFTHMYLHLKTSGTLILSDICLAIRPFQVTAIMGPSGAGKTSLLALLRGQAHYANITGTLAVNGHEVPSLESFQRRTAYVPQEDIVSDELSAEENILYAALLFNRRGYLTAAECMPMVLRAERLLDISHIRTSVVGSPSKRGISGGQKKRVSIGMELMKEAELFFLDEPTSGLDSASSMLVVSALHFLASKGVTVCTTIHQPRQEILNLMDTLVLLAPGGRVAYYGPITDVQAHFSALHYTCPPGTNIADFVMDTLCGFVPLDGAEVVQEVQHTIEYICDWWSEHKYPDFRLSMSVKVDALRQISTVEDLTQPPISKEAAQRWRYDSVTQDAKVFWTCFCRQARTNHRSIETIAAVCMLLMVFGIIVAFLIGPLGLDGESSSVSTFSAQITSGALVFSLLVQAASLRLFSADQLLRTREFNAGVAIAPYYLGKLLGNYCEAVLFPFAFLVGYYPFLKARAPFIDYWFVFLLLQLAVAGLVNLVAIAYPAENKGTFAVGCVVLLWSFGGVSPPLPVMEDSMSTFAVIVNYISPFKYSFTAEVIGELSRYPSIWDTESFYRKLDYETSDRPVSLVALVVYFIVANGIAYLCAVGRHAGPKQWKLAQERLHRASNGWLFSPPSTHLTLELSTTEGASPSAGSLDSRSVSDDEKIAGSGEANGHESAPDAALGSEPVHRERPSSSILRALSAYDDSHPRRAPAGEKTVRWSTNMTGESKHESPDSERSALQLPGSWDTDLEGQQPHYYKRLPDGSEANSWQNSPWTPSLRPGTESDGSSISAGAETDSSGPMLELIPISPEKSQDSNGTAEPLDG